MNEEENESEENESEENESEEERTGSSESTNIRAELGSLQLEVETQDVESCQELFKKNWEMILEDAADMSEATREKLRDT